MTVEEAKEIIIRERDSLKANPMVKVEDCLYEAFDMAVKALEQEPCDDCVRRQEVLKIIDGWYDNNRDTENIEDLIVLITYMCSVNPQKLQSEWQKDHEILKAYSDGANEVLDKIRAEISEQSRMHIDGDLYIKTSACMQIIDRQRGRDIKVLTRRE